MTNDKDNTSNTASTKKVSSKETERRPSDQDSSVTKNNTPQKKGYKNSAAKNYSVDTSQSTSDTQCLSKDDMQKSIKKEPLCSTKRTDLENILKKFFHYFS